MLPSTLLANKGETIRFDASIIGTLPQIPNIQILDLSDGSIEKSTKIIPESFTHIYQTQ
jgi:hypothetical protein